MATGKWHTSYTLLRYSFLCENKLSCSLQSLGSSDSFLEKTNIMKGLIRWLAALIRRTLCYKEQARIYIQILRVMLNWADSKTVCRAVPVLNTNWKTGAYSFWRNLFKVLFQSPWTWLLRWFLSHYGNPLVSICCIPVTSRCPLLLLIWVEVMS